MNNYHQNPQSGPPHLYLITVARNLSNDLTQEELNDLRDDLDSFAERISRKYRVVCEADKQDNDDYRWVSHRLVPKCSQE